MSKPTPDLSVLSGSQSKPPAATSSSDDPPYADFGIRIAKDGTWYHNGLPFTRMPLVKLFCTVLKRAENGDYLLATPVERGKIEVEDAPFVAVEMQAEGSGRDQNLKFRTNIDEWVTADEEHSLWLQFSDRDDGAGEAEDQEPRPYVMVRPGLEALIVRSVFYDLIELAEEQSDGSLAVWSGGKLHSLGQATA